MRVPPELAVQALIRRAQAGGAACYVAHRGDADRGALYVKVSLLDGRALLYGPAPMSLSDRPGERGLVALLGEEPIVESDVDAHMRHQIDFDDDLWLVEIEDKLGRSFLID